MPNFGEFKGREFGSSPGFNATAGAGAYQRGRPSGNLGTQTELPSGNLNTQQELPSGNLNTQTELPSGNLNTQQMLPTGEIKWGARFNYAEGGMVPGAIDDGESPMENTFSARMDNDIRSAMSVVNRVLNFGRKQNGLPEVQSSDEGQPEEGVDTAGMIPAVPHNETPKPQPQPGHLPYRPWEKPFGKRVEADGEQEVAGMMPSVPFSETPKPQPMPGPLPPTSNPFGKRAEGGGEFETAGMMPSVPFSETPKPQPMPGPLPPTSNPFGKRADADEEAIPTDEETA